MRMVFLRTTVAAILLLAAGFGCGLLEDATTVTIETGWKSVTVDSDALGVTIPSGSVIPAVSCSASNDICAQATSGVTCNGQTYGCKVQCGSGGSCEIVADAERRGRVVGVRAASFETDDEPPWVIPPSRRPREPPITAPLPAKK